MTYGNRKEIFSLMNWLNFVDGQSVVGTNGKALSSCFSVVLKTVLGSIMKYIESDCAPFCFGYAVKWCEDEPCHSVLKESHDYKKCLFALKRHLWGNKTDFRFLLAVEILYTCKFIHAADGTLNEFLPSVKDRLTAICGAIMESLSLSKRQMEKVFVLEKYDEQLKLVRLKELDKIKNRRTREGLACLAKYEEQETAYNRKPVFNIAVCATMSAGKSTFINALLGNDYLPARNEATTARITSVCDKDDAQCMSGFAVKNGTVSVASRKIGGKEIDSWNSNGECERIWLQGDLDGISNENAVVIVHDTPGTNNSGNTKHHDITFDFLKDEKMDALVYVANATQLETTDEYALLRKLQQKVVANIPVIFVLNKADDIDPETESLEEIIAGYKSYLKEIGFENPQVYPVSAKAARLFKMALRDSDKQFTKRDVNFFSISFRNFLHQAEFDKTTLVNNDCDDKTIHLDGKNYKQDELKIALRNTGICQIESVIEQMVSHIITHI